MGVQQATNLALLGDPIAPHLPRLRVTAVDEEADAYEVFLAYAAPGALLRDLSRIVTDVTDAFQAESNLSVWTIHSPEDPARRAGFAQVFIDLIVTGVIAGATAEAGRRLWDRLTMTLPASKLPRLPLEGIDVDTTRTLAKWYLLSLYPTVGVSGLTVVSEDFSDLEHHGRICFQAGDGRYSVTMRLPSKPGEHTLFLTISRENLGLPG